jgi:hypothetical protein
MFMFLRLARLLLPAICPIGGFLPHNMDAAVIL